MATMALPSLYTHTYPYIPVWPLWCGPYPPVGPLWPHVHLYISRATKALHGQKGQTPLLGGHRALSPASPGTPKKPTWATSRPASKQASKPASQQASQPASQLASRQANTSHQPHKGHKPEGNRVTLTSLKAPKYHPLSRCPHFSRRRPHPWECPSRYQGLSCPSRHLDLLPDGLGDVNCFWGLCPPGPSPHPYPHPYPYFCFGKTICSPAGPGNFKGYR